MSRALEIIQNEALTYDQQVKALASLGESTDDTLKTSKEFDEAFAKGIFCDLNEGKMPFRPRYIVPDYSVLMEKGSAFLGLEKPTDIWEATNALLITYKHVPSITTFPVYLGNFDELLAPFIEDEKEARKALRLFLLHIDRTLTDSFVHANLGPTITKAGEIIMELTEEMQLAIPNLTLLYDEDITKDEAAAKALQCMLRTAKPSFANNKLFLKDFKGRPYGIASCYNGLLIGGGGFSLPRVRLWNMALEADNVEDFMTRVLPFYTKEMLKHLDSRVEFIVEQSSFFKSNFLVREGFLHLDRFTGLFGVVGMAECVNHLMGIEDKNKGYGNNKECDDLGVRIMDAMEEMVNAHTMKYGAAFDYRHILHAQVGIDSDNTDNSPGCRIPIYSEPAMPQQIMHSTRFHKYFPSGIGDIFKFDETWNTSPMALLDIIKGAFRKDMRYFSGYLADGDVVRVTGYLVKKSELAKLDAGEQSLNQVSVFGKGARDFSRAFDRKLQHESSSK